MIRLLRGKAARGGLLRRATGILLDMIIGTDG